MLNARLYLNKAYERIWNINLMYEGMIPFEAADVLMKELAAKAVPKDQITNGFMQALCRKPSNRKHLHSAIIQQEDVALKLKEHSQDVLYESLGAKFKLWICLMELELATTVSFRLNEERVWSQYSYYRRKRTGMEADTDFGRHQDLQ
jgi:hypothetical protein